VAAMKVEGLASLGLLPDAAAAAAAWLAGALTIVAMATLGLGVDVRLVARSGLRVTAAGIASLLLLAAISFALIRVLGVS